MTITFQGTYRSYIHTTMTNNTASPQTGSDASASSRHLLSYLCTYVHTEKFDLRIHTYTVCTPYRSIMVGDLTGLPVYQRGRGARFYPSEGQNIKPRLVIGYRGVVCKLVGPAWEEGGCSYVYYHSSKKKWSYFFKPNIRNTSPLLTEL